ncbi:unnamed protein product [Prorocentrum cordatum]|uniref:Sfi1 spindle body domain-containing protein n=1 Tax=Prorocentrum cordatum TaxID=2364126 RepID=A0ABN9TC27_9DINO|nr:unnamed protein product [Polarella glacialis]
MPQRSGPLAGCPCCRTPATTPSGSCSAPAPSSAGAGTGSCWRLAWCPGGSWPCTSGCGAATARSAGSRPPRCSSGATRARRGWTSRRMAQQLQRNHGRVLLQRCAAAWRHGRLQRRHAAELEQVRKAGVGRGVASSNIVAERLQRLRVVDAARRVLGAWARGAHRQRVRAQMDVGDRSAEVVARHFRAAQTAKVLRRIVHDWGRESLRERAQKASERSRLPEGIMERMADRIRAQHDAELTQWCLACWTAHSHREAMHRRHASELQELRAASALRGADRAERAAERFRAAEGALLAQCCLAAWARGANVERMHRQHAAALDRLRHGEQQLSVRAAAASVASRMAEDADLLLLGRLQAAWSKVARLERVGRKFQQEREGTADVVAERMRQSHLRELLAGCLAAWQREGQWAAQRARALGEREAAAERMAEKLRKGHIRELQLNTVAGWREEVQRAHRRAERDKHLAEREALAEKFAEKIRDTHSRELQLTTVAGWREEVQRAHRRAERDKHLAEREAAAEKFAEKIRDTHSRELQLNTVAGWREEVQRAHRRAERDKHLAEREAAAQRMAQRLIIGHGQELLAATVAHWHKEAHRLKERSRELADKEDAAARMADQFEKNHCRHLLASCVGAWAGHASRERARARQAAELDQLRNAQRERGDATAERLADSWVRARLHELVRACLDSWTEGAQQLRARRGRAEQVAEQWRSESLGALQRACLAAWSAWCRDARLQQERGAQAAEVARLKAMQNSELEQLRHVQRERGDATAERMADQFKAAREVGLLQQCMARWAPLAKLQQKSKEAALRAAEEWSTEAARELLRCTLCAWSRDAHREAARARHAAEMESWRESERVRGDGTAELMAERLRAERLRGLLQACLGAWQDDRARERSRAQHAEHAALVQRVAGRLRATRERAAEAQCRARSRRALGACVGAWARRSSQQAARAQAGWARRRRPEGLCFHAWARLASRQAPPVARGSVATLGAVVDADQLVLAADALPEQDAQAEPLPPRELTVGEAEALVEEVVALRSAGAELRARREALEEENAGLRRHCAGALRHADALAERAAAALWRRSARHPGGRSFRGWAVQAARERRAAAAAPAEGPWVSVDGGPFVAVGPLPPGGGPAPAGAGGAFGGGGDSAGLALDSW